MTSARTRGGYVAGQLTVHRSPAEIAAVTKALRGSGRKVALVPTMGALHDGHRELIRHARRSPGATVTVVSIFVNPLQFGAGEDLERYPRPLEADLEACREEGVELVLLPGVADMYPDGADTTVAPGKLADELEGAVRPGHFGGVLTVVAKLFHIVAPDLAFFGEKDYQQLILIKKMARDLDFPVAVAGVPIVREPDGLALSSRNVYLSADERGRAATLQRALTAGVAQAARGPEAVLDAARAVLAEEPALGVEYLQLRSADLGIDVRSDLTVVPHGQARLLVAARLGSTRLIDNVPVRL